MQESVLVLLLEVAVFLVGVFFAPALVDLHFRDAGVTKRRWFVWAYRGVFGGCALAIVAGQFLSSFSPPLWMASLGLGLTAIIVILFVPTED